MPTCPHCGYEADPDAESCPLCGSALGEGAAPETEAAGAVAWESEGSGFPRNLWESWRASLTGPSRFFRRVGPGESLARPLLYFLLLSTLGALFSLVWESLLGSFPRGALSSLGYPVGPARPAGARLLAFFLSPFVALASLGVGTLVMHLFVLLVAPRRRGIRATARVLCYSSGPAALTVVPYLGWLVALIWVPVLQVVGVREVHRTGTGRAVLVVLGPFLLAFFLLLALTVLALLAGPELPPVWRPGT